MRDSEALADYSLEAISRSVYAATIPLLQAAEHARYATKLRSKIERARSNLCRILGEIRKTNEVKS